jgi:hypothetical protein
MAVLLKLAHCALFPFFILLFYYRHRMLMMAMTMIDDIDASQPVCQSLNQSVSPSVS